MKDTCLEEKVRIRSLNSTLLSKPGSFMEHNPPLRAKICITEIRFADWLKLTFGQTICRRQASGEALNTCAIYAMRK